MSALTNVNLKWVSDYTFIGTGPQGNSIIIDSPVRAEDKPLSLTPTQLLLSALGACSGIDVVSIMKKMRQDVSGLRIEVTGEKTPSFPKYYGKIHVKYIVEGNGIKRDALLKAIRLSLEKYCTVSLTVEGKAKIDWSYEIVDKRPH